MRFENNEFNRLSEWVESLTQAVTLDQGPKPEEYPPFLKEPQYIVELVRLIDALPDEVEESARHHHTASILAFDICVAQLQAAIEHGNKHASRLLNQLMDALALKMNTSTHTLGFWLPVLNAFYETHVELSSSLRDAYLDLVDKEEETAPINEAGQAQAMQEIISDLSELSVFDIADHFFSQSHAMPADFFIDLLLDLYSIEEGHAIALLFLLHPKAEVRSVVLTTLDGLMPKLELKPISLSRLQAIQAWYAPEYADLFHRWIKIQRRKGVVFSPRQLHRQLKLYATEVDGSGAQGMFIHLYEHGAHRICGLLFKEPLGIKETWVTSVMNLKEVQQYYREAFDEKMMLRAVDWDYAYKMINYFIALMRERGEVPNLHLLEVQEMLGTTFLPQALEIDRLLQELGIQIVPFTEEVVENALKRSGRWSKEKALTQSWFDESAEVDVLVNQCCSIVSGMKICEFEKAYDLVMNNILEPERKKWGFHFLWTAFWAKSKSSSRERFWQDSYLVAYAIYSGQSLSTIPIMKAICHLTVMNSLETMQERRAYLNQT